MSQSTTQQTEPYTPTQMVTVALQAQEWNLVFAGLAELPYRVSQPVIDKMKVQFSTPAPSLARPNGRDEDEDAHVYRRAREAG